MTAATRRVLRWTVTVSTRRGKILAHTIAAPTADEATDKGARAHPHGKVLKVERLGWSGGCAEDAA